MKLISGLVFAALLALPGEQVQRPDPYFTVNNQLVYSATTYPKDGNGSKMRVEMVVKSVDIKGSSVSSVVDYTQFNKYGAVYMRSVWNFACDTINYYVSTANHTYSLAGLGPTTETKGDSLIYPLRMIVGDTLKGAWAMRKTATDHYSTHRELRFSERKVIAMDTIETPAGRMRAYKIEMVLRGTSKTNYRNGDRSEDAAKVNVTEWFVPEIGIVKSEQRDADYGVTRVVLESYKK